MANTIIRRDTKAWISQTWISFAIAFACCVIGVWNLNGDGLERVLTAVCLILTLFATFALSKTIRDNQQEQVDTHSWIMLVRLIFVLAVLLCGWSFFRMNIEFWHKGYLIVASFYLLSSGFTLAKTIRDQTDIALLEQTVRKKDQLTAGSNA